MPVSIQLQKLNVLKHGQIYLANLFNDPKHLNQFIAPYNVEGKLSLTGNPRRFLRLAGLWYATVGVFLNKALQIGTADCLTDKSRMGL